MILKKYSQILISIILLATLSSWMILSRQTKPSLFLIGDSTVAEGRGWGKYLPSFMDTTKIGIRNYAVAGTSSRTFITNGVWQKSLMKKGLWDTVYAKLKKGDYVVMQFGHNDASALGDTARARGTIKGIGEETKEIYNPVTGKQEVVHSYGWYLRKLVTEIKSKGATPIICSLIPHNKWQDGKNVRNNNDYAKWAAEVAAQTGTLFIDLNNVIADRYDQEGETAVKAKYFNATDLAHPNALGSKLNAAMVAKALGAHHIGAVN